MTYAYTHRTITTIKMALFIIPKSFHKPLYIPFLPPLPSPGSLIGFQSLQINFHLLELYTNEITQDMVLCLALILSLSIILGLIILLHILMFISFFIVSSTALYGYTTYLFIYSLMNIYIISSLELLQMKLL